MVGIAERYFILDLANTFRKHFRDEPTVGDQGSPFMAFVLAVVAEEDIPLTKDDILRVGREQGFAEEPE